MSYFVKVNYGKTETKDEQEKYYEDFNLKRTLLQSANVDSWPSLSPVKFLQDHVFFVVGPNSYQSLQCVRKM